VPPSDITIFTIGHSNHDWRDFVRLLHDSGVTAIADVRSAPFSRWPYFSRDALQESLPDAGIEYLYFGQELGARRNEPECYVDDVAVYEKVVALPRFQQGLTRLLEEASRRRICLMCAEKEPLDCHRTVLVSRALVRQGVTVRHILADGTLEDHALTERRLKKLMGVERSLFDADRTDTDLLDDAYELRGRELAYRREEEGDSL
jgi:uncharacterized protein (DUF488 family)